MAVCCMQSSYPCGAISGYDLEQAQVLFPAWLGVASLRHGTGAKHREYQSSPTLLTTLRVVTPPLNEISTSSPVLTSIVGSEMKPWA